METDKNSFEMYIMTHAKYRDETWDFRSADTKQYTHAFHPYPAMMIPQVARRILEEFGRNAKLLFDPYCGSGTSLVEANLKNINAIGTDINPLARLIAKVKTTIIPADILDLYLKDFNDIVFSIRLGGKIGNPTIPSFKNIDYWFKKETQHQLAIIKEYIDHTIKNKDIADFFKVAFSETIREVSLTRNGEFKLYRMPQRKIENFKPDVLFVMMKKLNRNRSKMFEYVRAKNNNSKATIYDFNTVYEIPTNIFQPESVDIIVTSPPYGDSRTTVAYGQYSRLSNQWLGLEELNAVDKKCMGGIRKKEIKHFHFNPLDKILSQIASIDENRAYDVSSFYADYRESINNVSQVVKKGGIVAYVVGNRRVKGIEIPNDEITKDFFEKNQFQHIKTIIRGIPNKRMPKKNSPSNTAGITDVTMNHEYIVILKKK